MSPFRKLQSSGNICGRVAFLILAMLLSGFATAQDKVPSGQRIFTCGHSFHVFTYKQVAEIDWETVSSHPMTGVKAAETTNQ